MEVFGANTGKANLEFPTHADLQKIIQVGKPVKLQSIHWRNNDVLKGMQLKFTNGIETPIFQKDALDAREAAGRANHGKWALKSVNLDTKRRISKVSVRVRPEQYFMDGMRLYDENDEMVIDLKWCDSKDSVWETRNIPDGYEIIGLYMSKKGHEEAIQSLGFNLWKP